MIVQDGPASLGDIQEGNAPLEKRADRRFVGGIQDGPTRAAAPGDLASESERGERLVVRLFEVPTG